MQNFFIILCIASSIIFPQDHWETAVYPYNNWSYIVPVTEPPANWHNQGFDDSSWLIGPGGIGYGDEDDNTEIDPAISVYMRHTFNISDPSKLVQAIIHVDYDDGFVAYLNGLEIGRSFNMGNPGDFITFDGLANIEHEAVMYSGGIPEGHTIPSSILDSILTPGENVLAAQVHNVGSSSSDMTSNLYLSFCITDTATYYGPTPSWFSTPICFTESNLPIVVIDTYGQEILNDPRIDAHMGIIDNENDINNINDPFNGYDGHINIEIRGSSSQTFPKKQYALETQDPDGENLNVSILGMPEENDWILYAPYSDKSLIRNYLAYNLALDMGRYASRTRFCEVVINDDYKGLYIFMEKIKRDDNRVDIARLDQDETTGDDLTGGYILKIDKWDGENNAGWWSDASLPEYEGVWYQYHYPKPDDIVDEQRNYIMNFIDAFEIVMARPNYTGMTTGYYSYVNLESFIDVSLMSEISKNVDAYRLSAFMYKDKDSEDGRLTMGPIWDYNLAFGNADYYAGWETVGWQMDVDLTGDSYKIPFWWYRIWADDIFKNAFYQRWLELRQSVFLEDHIMNKIDSATTLIAEAQARNFQRWPILDRYIWPNAYVGGSYINEIEYLKDWITERLAWIDQQVELGIQTGIIIDDFYITSIYPNPFNSMTNIIFNIPQNEIGSNRLKSDNNTYLEVLDIKGRWVDTIMNQFLEPGNHNFVWRSDQLSSGIYFVRLQYNGRYQTQKLTLVK